MKTYIIFFLLLTVGFGNVWSQKDKFSVQVDGLGCPFCAYGLEKKFKDVEGISKISIEIESGLLTYEVPSTIAMSIAQVEERVASAGYTSKSVMVLRANGQEERSAETLAQQHAAEVHRKTFKVSGSCDMCKARIEKAALGVNGVQHAEWNLERQMLTVEFVPKMVLLADVQNAVAKVGHDNVGTRAAAKTYGNLPACCQYR